MIADFKYGDKVEINKDGAWICKGFVVKTTTVGAYVHGVVPGSGITEDEDVQFREWFPNESKRMKMVHCN